MTNANEYSLREKNVSISPISTGMAAYSQVSQVSRPSQQASSEEVSESASEKAVEASSGQDEGTVTSSHLDIMA
jgi:hypothetical protein